MSQVAEESVQGQEARPIRRVQIRPLFEDDGRRRVVHRYQVLLGEEDISHLVRRVEIDLSAGDVPVARLEILPSAVEVELDGLPVLTRGEVTEEELRAGAVDVTPVGGDGWRRHFSVSGGPPGYLFSLSYEQSGPRLLVRCPAEQERNMPDEITFAGATLVRRETLVERWAEYDEVGVVYRLAAAAEVSDNGG